MDFMTDERIVATKLEQIEQYQAELVAKQESLSHEEFLEETTERRAVERMFENAIQACADLAQHIATTDFDYQGESSKGAIEALGDEGVLDEETVGTLITAIGFRNVLAHEYGNVDYNMVYETLQTELDVYDAFSQQVARWTTDND